MKEIKEIYAWIAEEPDGEGICGHITQLGPAPLIGADKERIESLRDIAHKCNSVYPVKLVRFSKRTVLEHLVDPILN